MPHWQVLFPNVQRAQCPTTGPLQVKNGHMLSSSVRARNREIAHHFQRLIDSLLIILLLYLPQPPSEIAVEQTPSFTMADISGEPSTR